MESADTNKNNCFSGPEKQSDVEGEGGWCKLVVFLHRDTTGEESSYEKKRVHGLDGNPANRATGQPSPVPW